MLVYAAFASGHAHSRFLIASRSGARLLRAPDRLEIVVRRAQISERLRLGAAAPHVARRRDVRGGDRRVARHDLLLPAKRFAREAVIDEAQGACERGDPVVAPFAQPVLQVPDRAVEVRARGVIPVPIVCSSTRSSAGSAM
jgi:hypothetical protein